MLVAVAAVVVVGVGGSWTEVDKEWAGWTELDVLVDRGWDEAENMDATNIYFFCIAHTIYIDTNSTALLVFAKLTN